MVVNSIQSRLSCHLGLKSFVLAIAMVAASGCTKQWGFSKNNSSEQKDSEKDELENETLYVADQTKVSVQLTAEDSVRLKKMLEGQVVASQSTDSGAVVLVESIDKDLRFECGTKLNPVTQHNCFVIFNVEPLDSKNSVQYDDVSNEYMFQLLNPDSAKGMYTAMNVKEWDLQGSTYKRFASSDNRMIFECILDAERSRCSVFLSENGGSDYTD